MIKGPIYPGDALRLNGTVYIWLGGNKVTKGNGPISMDLEPLVDRPESVRVPYPGLTTHMQEIAARATVDLNRYGGCDCGAWTGNPCVKPNGMVSRRPHRGRTRR